MDKLVMRKIGECCFYPFQTPYGEALIDVFSVIGVLPSSAPDLPASRVYKGRNLPHDFYRGFPEGPTPSGEFQGLQRPLTPGELHAESPAEVQARREAREREEQQRHASLRAQAAEEQQRTAERAREIEEQRHTAEQTRESYRQAREEDHEREAREHAEREAQRLREGDERRTAGQVREEQQRHLRKEDLEQVAQSAEAEREARERAARITQSPEAQRVAQLAEAQRAEQIARAEQIVREVEQQDPCASQPLTPGSGVYEGQFVPRLAEPFSPLAPAPSYSTLLLSTGHAIDVLGTVEEVLTLTTDVASAALKS